MLEETFSFEQSEIAKALAFLQGLLKSLPFVHIVRHQLLDLSIDSTLDGYM